MVLVVFGRCYLRQQPVAQLEQPDFCCADASALSALSLPQLGMRPIDTKQTSKNKIFFIGVSLKDKWATVIAAHELCVICFLQQSLLCRNLSVYTLELHRLLLSKRVKIEFFS